MTRRERDERAEQRILARLANLGDPEPPSDLVDEVMREVALRHLGSAREIALILAASAVALAAIATAIPVAPALADWLSTFGRIALLAKVGTTIAGTLLSGWAAAAFGLLLLGFTVTLLGLKGVAR